MGTVLFFSHNRHALFKKDKNKKNRTVPKRTKESGLLGKMPVEKNSQDKGDDQYDERY
jgi:hypothetical protein